VFSLAYRPFRPGSEKKKAILGLVVGEGRKREEKRKVLPRVSSSKRGKKKNGKTHATAPNSHSRGGGVAESSRDDRKKGGRKGMMALSVFSALASEEGKKKIKRYRGTALATAGAGP